MVSFLNITIAILYVCVSIVYIFFVCLDGEDIKPKWKQWLADKLEVKPIVKVRYAAYEVVRARVEVSRCYWMYCHDKELYMKRAEKEAIETLYDEILKGMIENNLIFIQQHKNPINGNVIYEGMCNIYKEIKYETRN